MADRPQAGDERVGAPLQFSDAVDSAQAGGWEFATEVRVRQEVRPGRVTTRDSDFRRPDYLLFGQSNVGHALEDKYEQYEYTPGESLMESGGPSGAGGVNLASQVERTLGKGASILRSVARVASIAAGRDVAAPFFASSGFLRGGAFLANLMGRQGSGADTPVADDRGRARFEDARAGDQALMRLEALRTGQWQADLKTNIVDASPGQIFKMVGHPRVDLTGTPLLVTRFLLQGEIGKEWVGRATVVSAEAPYRPKRITPKPRIWGTQSAVVVGPENEEIYTDEFGRVRVQFRWDREGNYNGLSSIWMRVTQGWAGGGYGFFTVPRIGHEVLVGFLDGDPDCPIITGRVHNGTQQVPYRLPDNKTVSTLRTQSTPGSEGYNEIGFEDAVGRERIYVQAERDHTLVVKNDEQAAVGHDRVHIVQNDDELSVTGNRLHQVHRNEERVIGLEETAIIGLNRTSTVGVRDETVVGERFSVRIAPGVTKNFADVLIPRLDWPVQGTAVGLISRLNILPFGSSPQDLPPPPTPFRNAGPMMLGLKPDVDGTTPSLAAGSATELTLQKDKIILSTGKSSIVLDGGNVSIFADGNIRLHAGQNISVVGTGKTNLTSGVLEMRVKTETSILTQNFKAIADTSAHLEAQNGDLVLQGGPNLQLNPTETASSESIDIGPYIAPDTGAVLVADAGGGGSNLAMQQADLAKIRAINQQLWDAGLRGHNWVGNVGGGPKCEDVAGAVSFALQQVLGFAGLQGAPSIYIMSFQGNDRNIISFLRGQASHSWVMVEMRWRDGTRYQLHIDNWQGGQPVYSNAPIIADGTGGGTLLSPRAAAEHSRSYASDGALEWALSENWRTRLGY
ncbi:MAG: type VI secretion system tip protein VgrG [Polyangiaceae bacterium]|nr:type VI secretion system tip protein VgrG [Polyangiaceae bacterium]